VRFPAAFAVVGSLLISTAVEAQRRCPPLPEPKSAVVVRTDFSDDQAYEALRNELLAPVGPERFVAHLVFLSDARYKGCTPKQLTAAAPKGEDKRGFLFVIDTVAITSKEHHVLVLDTHDKPGRWFRAIPRMVQSIENNLEILNIFFHEFADRAAREPDGVLRELKD
jgi:hypothetical protein